MGPLVRNAEDLVLMMKVMAGDNVAKLRLDDPVDFKNIKVGIYPALSWS